MQNSYIVDVFLSGALWALTTFLFFDIKDRIINIDKTMLAHTLTLAMNEVVKLATIVAAPFGVFYLFLLWRFYSLMVLSESWGYGGMGLLLMFLLAGLFMIWLEVMLIFVSRSRFVNASKNIREVRSGALAGERSQ